MMRRANWLAAVGSATLGLAGLAGCQSMGGYPTGSWNGERSLVRAAEPDDPSALPSLQLRPIQASAAEPPADDPFAPITVEQFLPATARDNNRTNTMPGPSHHTAQAGYVTSPPGGYVTTTPPTTNPGPIPPPAPMAVMAPMGSGPMSMGGQAWDSAASMHGGGGGCSQCGATGDGCSSTCRGMFENMVIFTGGDYFSNSGAINRDRLFNKAINTLGVVPFDVPELDPQRLGGMFSINAGAPLTSDGGLAFQVGGTYVEEEEGAQGFFTIGAFHRGEPGDACCINWGVVYDIMYDDFIDYCIGQFRFKAGYAVTARDEVGGWVAVGTNTERVFLRGTDIIVGDPLQTINPNVIEARVRPECNGYFFWRHVCMGGAEGTIFAGGRENLGGAFVLGYTTQVPITDCCAVMSGGHMSTDSDDRGSYDVYLGLGYFPGGNARSAGACGNRYLPYLEAANNNVMPMSINPRQLILLGVPPGPGSHVPL